MGDTETHYINIERPKLLEELADLKAQTTKLSEEAQQTKMEHNLA